MAQIVSISTPVTGLSDSIVIDALTDRLLIVGTAEDTSFLNPVCTIDMPDPQPDILPRLLQNTPVRNLAGGVNEIVAFEVTPANMPPAGNYNVAITNDNTISNGRSFLVYQIQDSLDANIAVVTAATGGDDVLSLAGTVANDDALGILVATNQAGSITWTATGVTEDAGSPHSNGDSNLFFGSTTIADASALATPNLLECTLTDSHPFARIAAALIVIEHAQSPFEVVSVTANNNNTVTATINNPAGAVSATVDGVATTASNTGNVYTFSYNAIPSVGSPAVSYPRVDQNITIDITDGVTTHNSVLPLLAPSGWTALTVANVNTTDANSLFTHVQTALGANVENGQVHLYQATGTASLQPDGLSTGTGDITVAYIDPVSQTVVSLQYWVSDQVLAIDSAGVAVIADDLQLVTGHNLVIDNTVIALNADAITLSNTFDLSIDNVLLSINVDSVALSSQVDLAIDAAVIGLHVDSLQLPIQYTLDIRSALFATHVDSLFLLNSQLITPETRIIYF